MVFSKITKPLRILWIDDDENVLDFCGRSLRAHGAELCSAESGQEALRILMESDVDVVLSDLEMEGLDGLEVAKRVNEMFYDNPGKRPAFVILTGWAREVTTENIEADYFVDAFLEKPVEMRQLLKKLEEIIAIRKDKFNDKGY